MGIQDRTAHTGNIGETQLTRKKPLDRDLVGRI